MFIGSQGLRAHQSRRVDGVEATIQFDSCAGSGGQARRRREGVGCREERRQTKELHGPKLALGNAYSVCLSAAMSCAAPCCKSKLAAMLCARRERPASTNFGSGAMRWSEADCCWPSRACNRFLVRAQLAERRREAEQQVQNGRVRTTSSGRCPLRTASLGSTDGWLQIRVLASLRH